MKINVRYADDANINYDFIHILEYLELYQLSKTFVTGDIKNFKISNYMVHEKDKDAFEDHNSRVNSDYKFLPHLAPEPWIGNTKAPVLVLLANPGATRGDVVGKPQKSAELINETWVRNKNIELDLMPGVHRGKR